jgi:hypothetical protein
MGFVSSEASAPAADGANSMLQATFPSIETPSIETLASVETRTSWMVATVVLVIMAIAFGAP